MRHLQNTAGRNRQVEEIVGGGGAREGGGWGSEGAISW